MGDGPPHARVCGSLGSCLSAAVLDERTPKDSGMRPAAAVLGWIKSCVSNLHIYQSHSQPLLEAPISFIDCFFFFFCSYLLRLMWKGEPARQLP